MGSIAGFVFPKHNTSVGVNKGISLRAIMIREQLSVFILLQQEFAIKIHWQQPRGLP